MGRDGRPRTATNERNQSERLLSLSMRSAPSPQFSGVWAKTWRRAARERLVHYGRPMAAEPEGIQVPVVWLGVEEVPILFANAFVSQIDAQTLDSLVLTVGQMTQPAISGATEQERRQQVENVAYVPIKPVVRLGLTEARAKELIATLGANLDHLEQARKLNPGDPR